MTQTDKSKSMRRQRASLWIHYPEGDCWALVTSSPMPPEQGLRVGQVGFLIRLCSMLPRTCLLHHHEIHPMHRLSSEPCSLLCSHTSVTRWVRAKKWDRSPVSWYRRLRVGLCSADKTRGFERLQTEERARSRCPSLRESRNRKWQGFGFFVSCHPLKEGSSFQYFAKGCHAHGS